MRFLILGGIGYVGGRLSNFLKDQGHFVRVTTRRRASDAPPWLKASEILQADPLDIASLRPAFSSIDVVIDLAAPDEVRSSQNPQESLEAGAVGTWNILQALSEQSRPPAMIYLSTFHVYGKNAAGTVNEELTPAPFHPYSLGKFVGECVVQTFRRYPKIEGLIVRLSNAFGAPAGNDIPRWSLVFNDFCRQAISTKTLTLKTKGTQRRNFIPLTDVVRALEYLATHRDQWPKDGVIHVGSDQEWSILQAAEKVAASTREVLGYLPPIVVPTEAPLETGQEFQFSVDRLKNLGFTWTSPWQQEIASTLTLLRDAAQTSNPHG